MKSQWGGRNTLEEGSGGARWPRPLPRPAWAVAGVVLVGLFLLLVVPYFLPMRPALADAYFFGYCSKGAVVLSGLFALGFAVWYGPLRADVEAAQEAMGGSRRALWAMLGTSTALHLLLWLACLHFGPLQEAIYLVDRLRHLASGERVFRDFEMAYGAGLLYFPLWLSRGLRLSLLSGYCLALLLEQAVGILLLWYLVQRAGLGYRRRNIVFVLLCLTCLAWVPLAPAQYTTFRYCLTPAIACFAYEMAFLRGHRWAAFAVLVAGFALALVISPEQAIPLAGGTCLFGIVFAYRQWRWLLPGLVAFLTLAAGMLYVAYRSNALETLINIGLGAYAVPVGPAPVLLPLLPLLLVAACVFVEAVRRRSGPSAALVLLCLGPFSLSAAFGRFDAVHLIANTLPVTLVAWMSVSRNRLWWRWLVPVYVLVVFLLPTQLPIVYRDTFRLRHAPAFALRNDAITPGLPTFYSPFGRPIPALPRERMGYNYATGRFYGTTDLITPQQAQEKVRELRAEGDRPILFAPFGCPQGGGRRAVMLYNFGLWYPRPHHTVDALQAICDEMTHYERIADPPFSVPAPFYLVRRRPIQP